MNTELKLAEAQLILQWFMGFKEDKIKKLPIKAQWHLLSNIKEIQPVVRDFEEIRNNFIEDIKSDFFSDEKSEMKTTQQKDSSGNPMLDDQGNPLMAQVREVKEEFTEAYLAKIEEVNDTIRQMSEEPTTYDFKPIDVESLLDVIGDDSGIELSDLEIISMFSC